MGRFGVGHQKMGGRQRGTVNHRTLCLDEILEQLKLNIPERIVSLLPHLTPDRQADVLLELMQYQFPKRKAIEVYDSGVAVQEFELSHEQMLKMAKELLCREEAVSVSSKLVEGYSKEGRPLGEGSPASVDGNAGSRTD